MFDFDDLEKHYEGALKDEDITYDDMVLPIHADSQSGDPNMETRSNEDATYENVLLPMDMQAEILADRSREAWQRRINVLQTRLDSAWAEDSMNFQEPALWLRLDALEIGLVRRIAATSLSASLPATCAAIYIAMANFDVEYASQRLYWWGRCGTAVARTVAQLTISNSLESLAWPEQCQEDEVSNIRDVTAGSLEAVDTFSVRTDGRSSRSLRPNSGMYGHAEIIEQDLSEEGPNGVPDDVPSSDEEAGSFDSEKVAMSHDDDCMSVVSVPRPVRPHIIVMVACQKHLVVASEFNGKHGAFVWGENVLVRADTVRRLALAAKNQHMREITKNIQSVGDQNGKSLEHVASFSDCRIRSISADGISWAFELENDSSVLAETGSVQRDETSAENVSESLSDENRRRLLVGGGWLHVGRASDELPVEGSRRHGPLGAVMELPKRLDGESVPEVRRVCHGTDFNVALTVDGEVYTWKPSQASASGALGRLAKSRQAAEAPARIHLPGLAVDVSCGTNHVLALLEDGSVFSWGRKFVQALPAIGRGGDPAEPGIIEELKRVVQIGAGGAHSAALTAEGKLWVWGEGEVVAWAPFVNLGCHLLGCASCGNPGASKRCSVCKAVKYCNADCQKQDRKRHCREEKCGTPILPAAVSLVDIGPRARSRRVCRPQCIDNQRAFSYRVPSILACGENFCAIVAAAANQGTAVVRGAWYASTVGSIKAENLPAVRGSWAM